MSRKLHRAVALGLASAGVSLLAACGSGSGNASNGSGTTQLKAENFQTAKDPLKGQSLSMSLQGGYAPDEMIFAHTVTLLRSWGASVKAIDAGSTQIELGALTAGQTDIAEASPQAGLAAIDSGLQLQALAITGPKDADVFASAPSVASPGQLNGKKVSVFATDGLNGIETQIVTDSGHIPLSSVHVLQGAGQSVRLVQLQNGSVQGTPIEVDVYDLYLKPKGFHLLYNYMTQQPNLVAHLLWAKPQWISSHPQLALAVDEAVLLSYRWFDAPGSEGAFTGDLKHLVSGTSTQDADVIYSAFRQYKFYPPNYVMTNATMAYNQQLLFKFKQITSTKPVSSWVAPKYDAEALAILGKE